jgi:hypothetical protein
MWKIIPDEYHYHKGGGNGAMIAMMMQMEKNAAEAKQAEQARNDQADQLARETKLAEQQKLDQDKFNSTNKVTSAYDSALSAGKQRLLSKGIDIADDPYGIMSMFTGSLDRARAGAPEIVQDPNSLFSSTLLDDAMSEARGNQRSKLGSTVKNNFADDYGRTQFADTADDAYLMSILEGQQAEAKTALDRALARGTINEVGRTTADTELANMYKMGLAKANSLGDTVLGGYRGQLDTSVGKIRDKANNWDFGDTFNFDTEKSGVDSLKNSLSGKLEGDILNALSGQKFFDDTTLLGKAGSATGITNNNPLGTNNSPLLGSIAGSADRTKTATTSDRKLNPLDEVF